MKKLTCIILLISYHLIVFSQQQRSSYYKQWNEIDSLIIQKNLPKTALQKVNILYADAKKQHIHDEVIKSLIYRLSLEEQVKDIDVNEEVALLKDELENTADIASKSILQVLLAHALNDYYSENLWKNNRRTEIVSYKDTDITTWSNEQLIQTIDSLFNEATDQKEILQNITTAAVNAVVIKGNAGNTRPTLYDLVAHEMLDYYKTGLAYITQPAYAFTLNDSYVLAKTEDFINHTFNSKDSSSHLLKALQLFQQLIRFHLKDNDTTALTDVNIERIKWAFDQTSLPGKEDLYKAALKDITDQFANLPAAAEAWFLLANIDATNAASYQPYSDTTNRYAYVKAKELIELRLHVMQDTCFGNEQMKALLSRINAVSLSSQAESINIPGKPFRVLISYKNVDTLYERVLMQKDVEEASRRIRYNHWKDAAEIKPVKSFEQLLPQTNDYQQHSVEIKIDALPPGNYEILFSSRKDFDADHDKLALQSFTVSALAYMRNDFDYYVVDRESGQPLEQVKVTGTLEINDKKMNGWITRKIKTLHTDSLGHFVIPADKKKVENFGEIVLKLQKDNDVLETSDQIYNYRYSNNNDDTEDDSTYEDDNAKVYFFTDRSIYRPGQTVFYKGFVTTKDKKTSQYKLYKYTESIEVDLRDVNGKTIDSINLKLNDYSSFSGKFVIPLNVLTGEFSIETLDFEGTTNFNVEEYKRPTYYAGFDTLKNSYRLNDTITMSGYAKYYAGNPVTSAKLNYHIERNARFPYSWLFWKTHQPHSDNTEIADSTISIDENGKFEIKFIAAPDSSIDKKTEPVFNFQIQASVVDANGETREATTTVSVGYQSLTLQLKAPAIAEVAAFKDVYITTKNNAGENIPANVNIVISALQTPRRAYNKRLWQQPDQFAMDKKTFEKYFPNDEYDNETDFHAWKKTGTVITDSFNTIITSKYQLQQTLKQGWYCIEASTKDKDGNEIKDVQYVQLYNMQAPGLPAEQVNFSNQINNTGEPGDKAQLLIGTSEANVFVVEKITKSSNDSVDLVSYLRLNNNKKQLEYTIQPDDNNNAGLYYAFIKHNRFYTSGMQIFVLNNKKNLNINYASYRNKTEPGSKETWTVQVNNDSNKKADAELLTSMYDASLDQFKKQQWQMPDFYQPNYVSNNWIANNFNVLSADENWHYTYSSPVKLYDHLALSADELWTVYKIRKLNRIEINKFSPPKIVYDNFSSAINGKALGVSANLNDVVVVGYGTSKKDLTGSVSSIKERSLADTGYFHIQIRGLANTSNLNSILVVIDGKVTSKKIDEINADEIDNVSVYKGSEAVALYGTEAANGVIVITTKEFTLRNGKKKEDQPQIQVRKNFRETAFFFPQLYADSAGNYTFSFTMPDALTEWKWMSLAYTKDFAFGLKQQNIITQKTLMVQPNLPRFLRSGDKIELTAKISNLGDSVLSGAASLELNDAVTNQSLNGLFNIAYNSQHFSTMPNQTSVVKFPVTIPVNYNNPITVRIIAKAKNYSDGEENTLPVLTNRILVTETLPLFMQGEGTRQFKFEKLINTHSSTLTNESITVEYTPDPVWIAVQSLPYLMQFPHECAEQTFDRFYANALGAYIVSKHPQIRQFFDKWMKDSSSLESNVEKNQELKQVLLAETPWVINSENEAQQKKNVALLFDVLKMANSTAAALGQLKQMQLGNGAFAWFKGGYADRYITQYILTGIGKLTSLNAVPPGAQANLNAIATKALTYLDKEAAKDYNELLKSKADMSKDHLTQTLIQYWYIRSFFENENLNTMQANELKFFTQQAEKFWTEQSPYMQGMIAIALHRFIPALKASVKSANIPLDIIHSLKENAVTDSVKGMYWKNNTAGYYWYQAPVETQALLINAFKEITHDDSAANEMCKWLILNKQTNNWATTTATADACFSLLSVTDKKEQNNAVNIQLGDSVIIENKEAGSDYIKHRIDGNSVNASMGNISVSVSGSLVKSSLPAPSYGAVYWQYFEDIDKITAASSPLSVTKQLFVEKNADKGKILQPVSNNDSFKVGDKVIVRIVVKSDRDMEYIYLKDMRAASMEPVNVLSEYKWQDGIGYYEATKDATTNFFIDHLAKGTYVFEYPSYITHAGNYSVGIASIQCMYAPEFSAHSEAIRINIKENDFYK